MPGQAAWLRFNTFRTLLTCAAHLPCAAQLWMLTNLKKWWHAFEHNYTHHLEMQDKFFFPLRTCLLRRSDLPSSAD